MNRLLGLLIIAAVTTQGHAEVREYSNEEIALDPITLISNTTELSIGAGWAEQRGIISDGDDMWGLSKVGAGELIFSGANSYTGATRIEGGQLTLATSDALSDLTSVTVNAGATLAIRDGLDVSIGSLAGAGYVLIGATESTWLTVGGDNFTTFFSGSIMGTGEGGRFVKTGAGKLTLTGNSVIDGILDLCGCAVNNVLEINGGSFLARGGTDLFGGIFSIVNGGKLFTDFVIADGEINISGAGSAMEGTTIHVGTQEDAVTTLTVSDGGEINADSVYIAFNAVLQGDGVINAETTIGEGSRLAPGESPRTMTFTQGLVLEDGAILEIELGTLSDLIRISGGNFTGDANAEILINLFDSGGFEAGTYTIIDFTGADLLTLSADSFIFGSTIAGYEFTVLQEGSEFHIVATAIPEPSTYVLMGAAGLILAGWRRKRS